MQRLKAPFEFLLNATLAWKPLLQNLGLAESGLEPDNVCVRTVNNSTGPTFLYGHVVRHPRYRDRSSTTWRTWLDLQTEGAQAEDETQYILLARASQDCALWVHAAFGMARRAEARRWYPLQ